jgi:cell division protein FtsB
VLCGIGVALLLAMHVRLWFSDIGVVARHQLTQRLAEQTQQTERLAERNRLLAAEVAALKGGLSGVEARARSELGMIKDGETFYLVVDP